MRTAPALGAAVVVLALATLTTAPGAYAADTDGVDVVNTETVQVYVTPDGDIASQRVYEQLTMTGSGPVELSNPIEQDGLRNLDGFSGLSVEDGVQDVNLDVDGSAQLRSVSNYTGDLPLDISIEYRLDGERIDPSDVVGADGELEVLYTVKNITAQPQEVSFPDGHGGEITETVDVPIPIVGSLTTVAPANFTDVQSDQANMAGDGQGGTKLSFTMTLFPPIGSDTAEFGYTATGSDGVVPPSSVSALPVNPLEVPTFKSAGDSYRAGSDTGVELADGATTIDTNLLKLRDGAAKLLAGLIKLSDGADQLTVGLAGDAAPGAQKLADGAGELNTGLGKIDDGAGQLADGAGQVADGAGRLSDGTGRLDDGARKLSNGATAAAEGSRELADGAQQLEGGLGRLDRSVRGNLSDGVGRLVAGQKALAAGLAELHRGVADLPATVQAQLDQDPKFQLLLASLQSIADGIDARLLPGLQHVEGSLRAQFDNIDKVAAALRAAASTDSLAQAKQALIGLSGLNGCAALGTPPPAPSPGQSQECQLVSGVYHGLIQGQEDAATKLNGAAGTLNQITDGLRAGLFDGDDAAFKQLRAGLSTGADPRACLGAPAGTCGIKEGALAIRNVAIPMLIDGVTASIRDTLLAKIGQPASECDPTQTLRCGAAALVAGGEELTKGVDELVAGVRKLSSGGALLAGGAGDLSRGLDQLDSGANQLATGSGALDAGAKELAAGTGDLADGAGQLAAGTGDASDGSQQLADGAGKLASGLGDAADGSGRLADGIAKAAEGAPKLVDGAGRLSDEGMSQLIGAGEDTAQDYGKLYATIEAGAARADAEKMAYGAPEGAQGLTAYSYELLGDDGETGRNTKRGLAALVLLGLGGAFLLRRRLV